MSPYGSINVHFIRTSVVVDIHTNSTNDCILQEFISNYKIIGNISIFKLGCT